MILINTRTRQPSDFFEEQRPPYAILSHTWGTDEVTLRDLDAIHQNNLRQTSSTTQVLVSAGWRKIEASCDQAARDGFEWIWVDTCCIDKSSSAELSEAINSMYAWYKDSQVCYAFLSDVKEVAEDLLAPGSSFRTSRWFTRGWTLQELLAPEKLVFLNSNWQTIGQLTKDSKLSEAVSQITSIPPAFLEGLDLRKAIPAMKMSWASKRVTTRKEDLAYCLLGIFDVNMPLLYGEGAKAFGRLQEEILKRTHDHSLLAWGQLIPCNQGFPPSGTPPCGVLATSAAEFLNGGSLSLCPRFADYKSPKDYRMTNEGLRVQLVLCAPISAKDCSNLRYAAVLDCFCRKYPTRRIAIPLRKVRKVYMKDITEEAQHDYTLKDGDIFVRTGPILLLSDISPSEPPRGYNYVYKTIIISAEKDVETNWSRESSLTETFIDLPPDYRCDIIYINPSYKVEKDPHTVEPRSLRIQTQRPEQLTDIEKEVPSFYNDDRRSAYSWYLPRDMSATIYDITVRQLESAKIRPRLDSIIICLQLTRENHVRPPVEPTSVLIFLAFISDGPRPNAYPWCGLSPFSEQSKQVSLVNPSAISQDLVGQRTLQTPHDKYIVRDVEFAIPDSSMSLKGFLIDVQCEERSEIPQLANSNGEQLWMFINIAAWLIHRARPYTEVFIASLFLVGDIPHESQAVSIRVFSISFCIVTAIPPILNELRTERGEAYAFLDQIGRRGLSFVIIFTCSYRFCKEFGLI
ncbi:MAG: hypothetical protein Q9195_000472 [Heterodermia aff. obscurata]